MGWGWGQGQSLKDLWGYNKRPNIPIMGAPKGEQEKVA